MPVYLGIMDDMATNYKTQSLLLWFQSLMIPSGSSFPSVFVAAVCLWPCGQMDLNLLNVPALVDPGSDIT